MVYPSETAITPDPFGNSNNYNDQQQYSTSTQHQLNLLQPFSTAVTPGDQSSYRFGVYSGISDISTEADYIDRLCLSPISDLSSSSSMSSVPEDIAFDTFMNSTALKKSNEKKMSRQSAKLTVSHITGTIASPGTGDESLEDEEELRQKNLERNRLAASKCRQRKKEWMEKLAHKAERMSKENEYLKQVLNNLKEEMEFLKTQLYMHQKHDFKYCKSKAYFQPF